MDRARAGALGFLAAVLFALPNYQPVDLTRIAILTVGGTLSWVSTYLSARWE